jgi:hypothetical protein
MVSCHQLFVGFGALSSHCDRVFGRLWLVVLAVRSCLTGVELVHEIFRQFPEPNCFSAHDVTPALAGARQLPPDVPDLESEHDYFEWFKFGAPHAGHSI